MLILFTPITHSHIISANKVTKVLASRVNNSSGHMISTSVTKNVYYTPEFGTYILLPWGLPGGTSGKEPSCQCRRLKRLGVHPWLAKILGKGHGNQLQYSCLENPMDREAWCTTVHRVAKSQTWLKQLSMYADTVP